MNIVLAVALLTGLYMVKFQKAGRRGQRRVIGHVMPDSPAAKAGIQDGDRIVALDGKENPTWEDVGLKEVASAYTPLHLTVERDGKTIRHHGDAQCWTSATAWASPAGTSASEIQLGERFAGHAGGESRPEEGRSAAQRSTASRSIRATRSRRSSENSDGKPVDDRIYTRDGAAARDHGAAGLQQVDGTGALDDRRRSRSRSSTSITTKLSFPDALRESLQQNMQGRDADLRVPEGDGGAAHVAKILHGPHRDRPAFGRSRARRSFGVLSC